MATAPAPPNYKGGIGRFVGLGPPVEYRYIVNAAKEYTKAYTNAKSAAIKAKGITKQSFNSLPNATQKNELVKQIRNAARANAAVNKAKQVLTNRITTYINTYSSVPFPPAAAAPAAGTPPSTAAAKLNAWYEKLYKNRKNEINAAMAAVPPAIRNYLTKGKPTNIEQKNFNAWLNKKFPSVSPPPPGMNFEMWTKTAKVVGAKTRAELNIIYGENKKNITNANNAKYTIYASSRFRNMATALKAFTNWYKSQQGNNKVKAQMYLNMVKNNNGQNYKFMNGPNFRAIAAVNNTVTPNNPNANTRAGFWTAVDEAERAAAAGKT